MDHKFIELGTPTSSDHVATANERLPFILYNLRKDAHTILLSLFIRLHDSTKSIHLELLYWCFGINHQLTPMQYEEEVACLPYTTLDLMLRRRTINVLSRYS